jgi:hypothetical protein
MDKNIKAIALYLPQFHPIPENDEWWGKGFTEWTNVVKAKPLFEGHRQPRLPADLGFYDLRVTESRIAQATLAKQYGIYGFVYWHYWFAGKQVLETPLREVIASGQPDFPFCLAWANQTWSGTWHGLSNSKILVEQTYPGTQDHIDHFYACLPIFKDPRYIETGGKKLFFIYLPQEIPEVTAFIKLWQELAQKEGLGGFHFGGMNMDPYWAPANDGFDAVVQYWSQREEFQYRNLSLTDKIQLRLFGAQYVEKSRAKKRKPLKLSYKKLVQKYPHLPLRADEYPSVFCDWDNTPRSGGDGWLFSDFSPELFEQLCLKAFEATSNKPDNEKFVIIKSWNEWAEGNYLEPDKEFGHRYLEAFRNALERFSNKKSNQNHKH